MRLQGSSLLSSVIGLLGKPSASHPTELSSSENPKEAIRLEALNVLKAASPKPYVRPPSGIRPKV